MNFKSDNCAPALTTLLPSMNPEDLQGLVTDMMPYGKYKGRVLADLPGNYLNWFAREGFPKGELGRLLQLMQKLLFLFWPNSFRCAQH